MPRLLDRTRFVSSGSIDALSRGDYLTRRTQRQIGVHGGLSTAELMVPLCRFDA